MTKYYRDAAGLGRYAAKKLSVENAPKVAALNAIDTTNW